MLALLGALFSMAGCALQPPLPVEFSQPAAGESRAAVFERRWASYADWATRRPLQADCVPRLIDASPGVAYRGTVVLLHGFSACPQQYFELSQRLAERGFRSLLVLLPGHGHVNPAVDKDNPTPQPGPWNWKATYEAFAQQINGIMSYADGDRVIAGLSGGGSASLFINLNGRNLYDRNLVIAPFLAIAGGDIINAAVAGIGAIPVVNWIDATPFGTEKPCVEKRRQGKAGYCEYQVRHAAGMKSLAHWVRKEIRKAPLETQLQIVAVEHDNAVSNERIAQLLAVHEPGGRTSACAYEEGIPHSMFSRFDNPGTDMYWLDAFLDSAVGFIVDGQPFAVKGTFEAAGHVYDHCATALAVPGASQ
jgi:alpha-beta hydrolase superfamily lysophospholipase